MVTMRQALSLGVACLSLALGSVSYGQEAPLGASLEGLLKSAKDNNPEFASMRFDAAAATERVVSASALPDPKFRTEWRDITRMGEQSPKLLPARVGSTRYLLMQDLPWAGKRDLMREVATSDAAAAKGQRQGTWLELATRIKIAHVR